MQQQQNYTTPMPNVPASGALFSQYKQGNFSKRQMGNVTLEQWANDIVRGKYRHEVEGLRKITDEAAQKDFKKTRLPCVTPSALFPDDRHTNATRIQYPIICIDLDIDATKSPPVNGHLTAATLRELVRQEHQQNPNLLFAHASARGAGMALYYRYDGKGIATPQTHHDEFERQQERWAAKGVTIDTACSDPTRLRFASYDPNALLGDLSASIEQTRIEYPTAAIKQPQAAKTPKNATPTTNAGTVNALTPANPLLADDLQCVVDYVTANRIDLPLMYAGIDGMDEYSAWVKIGMALADGGPDGLQCFHAISSISSKYDAATVDDKWRDLMANTRSVTIKSFFHICHQCKIPTRSPLMAQAVPLIRTRQKSIGQNGGLMDASAARDSVAKYLRDIDHATPQQVQRAMEVFDYLQANPVDAKAETPEDEKFKIQDLERFIAKHPIECNTVTGKIELAGVPMDDMNDADLVLEAKKKFGPKNATRELVDMILRSSQTPRYDPFKRYITTMQDATATTGNVTALLNTLTFPATVDADFCRLLITKWLLSVAASMHGNFSVLCLVMVGKQNIGKTTFLRNLLPDELTAYYAESKLDDDKDAEILMCRKLIICDDEFSGKSKRDARRLKDMISKQTITVRVPYGRASQDLQRRAVLCGTSNTPDVLHDITGNRRVLPVTIEGLDFDAYAKIDRNALWGELGRMYLANPKCYMLTQDDITRLAAYTDGVYDAPTVEQERILSMFYHPNDEEIFMGNTACVTSTWIKERIERDTRHTIALSKINEVMHAMGYIKTRAGDRSEKFHIAPNRSRGWAVSFLPNFMP
jgi:hypothetical protein